MVSSHQMRSAIRQIPRMSRYLSIPRCRSATISIRGPPPVIKIVANLVLQLQRMVLRSPATASRRRLSLLKTQKKRQISSNHGDVVEKGQQRRHKSPRTAASCFGFIRSLDIFLTPERQHPQSGCHLSSIIPPLPG